ncbi:MAG: ATP-binding cassette domain-containing protein [Elusimicrobiota bacterium]
MIEAKNLHKKFGTTKAVDGVSFEIKTGQVVGFLGPNGAGKTTTMRLLTGYLSPDDGEATLLGLNLIENSIQVRQRCGYLPENNPLPEDIELTDYLHFIGKLRGLVDLDHRMERVKHVLKVCSLIPMIGKKLGELSKGYRQRVGLAQSIIHDPDILILDEPTSGLDPNQVQEVRSLISNLKKEKTLILSTHILSEVQHTCDRVLIINKGKVVADGTPQDLGGSLKDVNRLSVSFDGDKETIRHELENFPKVTKLIDEPSQEGVGFILESKAEDDLRKDIFRLASSKNWPILSLQMKKLSLEEVFRALTQTTQTKP